MTGVAVSMQAAYSGGGERVNAVSMQATYSGGWIANAVSMQATYSGGVG